MKRTFSQRLRTVVVLGLIAILALSLLPFSVLAYANPAATKGWGQVLQVLPKHRGPALLDEELPEETETPDADDDEGEEVEDPDDDDAEEPEEDETPDPSETPAVTSTLPITAYVVLRGPVTGLPADGLYGAWEIAGREVVVSSTTYLSERAREVTAGDWATARTVRQDDGTLAALSVTVMHANHLVRVVGAIDEINDDTWVVAGVTISVTAGTRIVGTPEVGRLADVHGQMDESGAFVARFINVRGTPNLPKVKGLPPGQAKKQTLVPSLTPEPSETPAAASDQNRGGKPGKGSRGKKH